MKSMTGVVLLVGALLTACSETAADAKAPTSKAMTDVAVCVAAHEAAKTGLKAPSSAKFPDSFCELLKRSSTLNEVGQTVWTISGPVDAQNGFGAMIRGSYTVEIVDLADGKDGFKYRVLSIDEG